MPSRDISADTTELFARAERPAAPHRLDAAAHPDNWDAVRLRHELHTYRRTLELRNEELRQAQVELERERARFVLYDKGIQTQSVQLALQKSVTLYRALFGNLSSGFAYCRIVREAGKPSDFVHLATNHAFELNTRLRDVIGRKATQVMPGIRESDPRFLELLCHVAATGRQAQFEIFVTARQAWYSISAYSPAPEHFVALFDVITERKRLENFREMGREVLLILNEPGELQESIARVLAVLKTRTGFDAVGVRLQNGDDAPYFIHLGFPEDSLLTQNSPVAGAVAGPSCWGGDGTANLACICGLVISGRTDPSNPIFTQGGSFWTNNSFPLLKLPPGTEPTTHLPSRCIHEGYASIALVPIRSKNSIVGLVQFNDRRQGCFSLEAVELLEGIVSHIAAALLRKQAEEEQLRLQAQLQQAQKMESVGLLAGGVAHDFNNMLSVILGHVNLALMDIAPEEPCYVNMEEIRKAAERSADLTRQLLAFARKQVVVPKVLDLNHVVAETTSMLQRLIGEEIALRWEPGSELWPVKVDPSQVDQILANLCVNARDAIAAVGKIVIHTGNCTLSEANCRGHHGFVPGEYVRIAVGDNGCGMDKDMLPRIFEPFFTTKAVGQGTGLGLSTVYGAVKQNSGFIEVQSEPGQGTTFSIYLPRHLGEAGQAPKGKDSDLIPAGSETILLVDDETAFLEMTYLMLTRQGYQVLSASTPSRAIVLAKDHACKIDLLVTDVVLPEMSGLELTKNLTALCPRLKHLFMSGYPAGIIADRGLTNERVHFIPKPFSLLNFAVKVREVLDNEDVPFD